jgi:hypothetical protein
MTVMVLYKIRNGPFTHSALFFEGTKITVWALSATTGMLSFYNKKPPEATSRIKAMLYYFRRRKSGTI